jgi:hypothetical protein
MTACPHCGAELETPLGCGACQVPLEAAAGLGPFEALGLTPSFTLDAEDLRARQFKFSRWIHPDFFAASPELRALAEKNTGHLNAALEALEEPTRRADQLVRSLDGPSDAEVREMPKAFLLEVLEWNEALEGARTSEAGSAQRGAAFSLEPELTAQRTERIQAITKLLDPLPESGSDALRSARLELNAVRYLDRALRELESLRLADAEAR